MNHARPVGCTCSACTARRLRALVMSVSLAAVVLFVAWAAFVWAWS